MSHNKANDNRLNDLLVRWAEARAENQAPTVEDLCRDCPDLAEAVRSRLSILHAMAWLEEPDDEDDGSYSLPQRPSKLGAATPSAMSSLSAQAFGDLVVASGILSADECAALACLGLTATGAELAETLIRSGKLTRFQVESIAAGRGPQLVLGNYILLARLGAGGMGEVFKARHRRMKRIVAIKLLPEKLGNSTYAIDRFRREVEAAAKLDHPNIVTAHDADEADGRHYLAMQYVDGQDLASLVRRKGPLTVGQAIQCILQAAHGLEYAHQRGIVHRDIKPANLLVDTSGVVKILDLGLARIRAVEEGEDSRTELTQEGVVMGTADYMAPEQAMDTHRVDQRADVYSLGCTLFYLLTGRPAYDGKNVMGKIMAHREQPIPSLSAVRFDAPPCLEAIFRKMLAKKPEQRYASMALLIGDLAECAELAAKTPVVWPSSEVGPAPSPSELAGRETSSSAMGDTLQHVAAPAERSAPAAPPSPSSVFGDLVPAGRPVAASDAPQSTPPSRRFWLALGGLTLALGSIIWLGVVVFRVPTPDGTIEIMLEGKTIKVAVNDDKTVTIVDPNDGKEITVRVDKGKRLLMLTKEGFQALVLEFNLTTRDGQRLAARFVPREIAVAPPKKTVEPENPRQKPSVPWQNSSGAAAAWSTRAATRATHSTTREWRGRCASLR